MNNGNLVRFGFRPIWGSHYAHIGEVIGERLTPQVVQITTESMCRTLVPTRSDYPINDGEIFTISTVGVNNVGAANLYYGTYTQGLEVCSKCLNIVRYSGQGDVQIQEVFLNAKSFKNLEMESTMGKRRIIGAPREGAIEAGVPEIGGYLEVETPQGVGPGIMIETEVTTGVDKPAMLKLFEEANTIINGQRNIDYGDKTESFTRIGKFWGAYLGIEIGPADVVDMMILLKLSRNKGGKASDINKRKRDGYRDVVGYAGCMEIMDLLAEDNDQVK